LKAFERHFKSVLKVFKGILKTVVLEAFKMQQNAIYLEFVEDRARA